MRSCILLVLCFLPALALAADAGVDTAAMNPSIDPCTDFYQYACGNWISHNPIPADRARYGRFTALSERNEKVLLDILQGAAANKPGRTPLEQKIGDFYQSCMDTPAIEKRGLAPLKPELARIESMDSREDVESEIARLHRMGSAGRMESVVFSFGAQPDAKDSTRTIASLSQGGLSLPDRAYYLKTDPKSVEIRQHFVEHMKKMFQLAGDPAEAAAAKAQAALDLETMIARDSVDRVTLRDPNKRYHLMTRKELAALAPGFDWDAYFKEVGAPQFDKLNVGQPEMLKQLAVDAQSQPIEAWRAYFEYHLLRKFSAQLPAAFDNENFDFWERYLTGAKQPRPRSSRCTVETDRSLGDLLGQKYIQVAFGPDAQKQITQMVGQLESTMGKDIQALPWMSDSTKKAALVKLKAITNNVGYPRKWRDYSKVTIVRGDFLGNVERAASVLHEQRLERIGQPTDKAQWMMTAPTVNAFYSPQNNSINFPAGILQSPFFDPQRDIALNYGAAGAVIGHEMTHGFDDQGRKYDGDGNLRDWWTPKDGAEFEKRAACIANEFSGFTAVDDLKLNGRLTLGENTADNGGLRIAYMALQDTLKGKEQKLNGLTPEQRFFLGFAQIWCENRTPQSQRQLTMTDPHSPGRYRVNGTLQNMPEFEKAFSCKAGQPMVSQNACRVW